MLTCEHYRKNKIAAKIYKFSVISLNLIIFWLNWLFYLDEDDTPNTDAEIYTYK